MLDDPAIEVVDVAVPPAEQPGVIRRVLVPAAPYSPGWGRPGLVAYELVREVTAGGMAWWPEGPKLRSGEEAGGWR